MVALTQFTEELNPRVQAMHIREEFSAAFRDIDSAVHRLGALADVAADEETREKMASFIRSLKDVQLSMLF